MYSYLVKLCLILLILTLIPSSTAQYEDIEYQSPDDKESDDAVKLRLLRPEICRRPTHNTWCYGHLHRGDDLPPVIGVTRVSQGCYADDAPLCTFSIAAEYVPPDHIIWSLAVTLNLTRSRTHDENNIEYSVHAWLNVKGKDNDREDLMFGIEYKSKPKSPESSTITHCYRTVAESRSDECHNTSAYVLIEPLSLNNGLVFTGKFRSPLAFSHQGPKELYEVDVLNDTIQLGVQATVETHQISTFFSNKTKLFQMQIPSGDANTTTVPSDSSSVPRVSPSVIPTAAPSSTQSTLSAKKVAGIIVGVLVLIAIVVATAIFCCREKEDNQGRRPLIPLIPITPSATKVKPTDTKTATTKTAITGQPMSGIKDTTSSTSSGELTTVFVASPTVTSDPTPQPSPKLAPATPKVTTTTTTTREPADPPQIKVSPSEENWPRKAI